MYFVIVGLVGIIFGVFGSVFNTYASLYVGKDNDMLFSMPIPPSKILLMRLSGVYFMGLLFELIVTVPALVAWFMYASPSLLGAAFAVLIPVVLSFLILSLSCILGFVVAVISSKLKNKSYITVIISLIFIGAYYYLYSKVFNSLSILINDVESVAENFKSILYPFYHMGLATEGKPLSMLIFVSVVAVIFGAVYAVMARTFFKISIVNKGSAKVKYAKTKTKAGNIDSALLKKEFKRFTGSSAYMLNCALGSVFMLAAAVAVIIKGEKLINMIFPSMALNEDLIGALLAAVICAFACMNDITSPSVSLEGKSIWLVQSLPVSPWRVLKAKLKLHLIITIPPLSVFSVCALAVLGVPLGSAVVVFITGVLFAVFIALFGLFMNLKVPNLKWTNEIIPIKQSASVLVTMLGGMGTVAGLGVLYSALEQYITPTAYIGCVCALIFIVSVLLFTWLKKKGVAIFAML